MSLEQALEANTAAVLKLAALIENQGSKTILAPLLSDKERERIADIGKAPMRELAKKEAARKVAEETTGQQEVTGDVAVGATSDDVGAAKESLQQTATDKSEPESKEAAVENTPAVVEETPEQIEARRADVRTIVLSIAKTKSREESIALMARFGATGISKIAPESFADVIAYGNKILSGEASALGADDSVTGDNQ